MPLSPLTRWLIGLTMIAFPMALLTMVNPESWLAPGTLGVALSLWTASVYRIVSAGANLDENAFHLTRPKGGTKAFWRTSFLLFMMVLVASMMVAVRAWWFHLGWRTILVGFTIAFALLLMITIGLATGLQLFFSRTRPVRWVGWLMIALPLAVSVYRLEMHRNQIWLGNRVMETWTSNLSPAVLIAAFGYGAAWWLSAGRRKWWPGLMVAALAGPCLSFRNQMKPLLGRNPDLLPMASVEFRRQPLTPSAGQRDTPEGKEMNFQPGDSVSFTGLRTDELLNGDYVIPVPTLQDPMVFRRFDLDHPGETEIALNDGWRVVEGKSFDFQTIDHFLAFNLGRPLVPEFQKYERSSQMFSYLKEAGDEVLDRLNREPWKFSGVVSRIEYQGSFPAQSSGSLNLEPQGHLDFQVMIWKRTAIRLSLQLMLPDPRLDGMAGASSYFGREPKPRLMLVSRSGARVAALERLRALRQHAALGSQWTEMEGMVSEREVESWPEDELSGARFHLFMERSVSRVEAEIPAPVK